MIHKNSLKWLVGATLLTTTALHAAPAAVAENSSPTNSPFSVPAQLAEAIPDDIWSTIASPFDPITTPSGFAPQQRVEQMQPRPAMQPQPAPRPPQAAAPAPRPAPEFKRTVQAPPAPTAEPQPHYPTQTQTQVTAPKPVPYRLPPQEKVAVTEYPEEYWDCLLNNLQGVGSDVAAKLITRACQKKHPKQ